MGPTMYWWKTTETWNNKAFCRRHDFCLGAHFCIPIRLCRFHRRERTCHRFRTVFRKCTGSTLGVLWLDLAVTSITFGQTMIKDKGPESVQTVALRSLGNTLEYGLMALLLIWIQGLYCNAAAATLFGSICVLARLCYPYFYGYYGASTVFVELATQPCYFAKGFLITSILTMLTTGTDLAATVAAATYQPLVCLGGWVVYGIVFGLILGMPMFLNFQAGAKRKPKMDEARTPTE